MRGGGVTVTTPKMEMMDIYKLLWRTANTLCTNFLVTALSSASGWLGGIALMPQLSLHKPGAFDPRTSRLQALQTTMQKVSIASSPDAPSEVRCEAHFPPCIYSVFEPRLSDE